MKSISVMFSRLMLLLKVHEILGSNTQYVNPMIGEC